MATKPDSIEYTQTPPQVGQDKADFNTNQAYFVNFQATTLVDNLNATNDYIEESAAEIEVFSDDAETAAEEAEAFATAAASAINFVGNWEDATGAGVAGTSYAYANGFIYLLKEDLANIASVEPSTDADIWQALPLPATNIDWDLEIPFNDSGEIVRGYSSGITIDINGTSYLTPSNEVDFSRTSSTGNINKSGVYEVLDDAVIAIAQDGVGVFGEYTCEPAYSEDFTTGSWGGVNCTLNTSSIELTSTSTFQLRKSFSFASSQSYTASILVDSNTISSFQMRTTNAVADGISIVDFDLSNESYVLGTYATSATIEKLADGYYEVSFSFTATSTASDLIQFVRGSGSIGDIVNVTKAQVTNTDSKMPYYATTSTSEVISPTILSVQTENNLPAVGESFTISIDCAGFQSVTADATRRIFHQDVGSDGALSLRVADDGLVRFYSRDSNGDFEGAIDGNFIEVGKKYNWKIVYDADTQFFKLYENGILSSRNSAPNALWSLTDPIYIGSSSTGTQSANTYFKNFNIVHRALSDSEIAVEGAPE